MFCPSRAVFFLFLVSLFRGFCSIYDCTLNQSCLANQETLDCDNNQFGCEDGSRCIMGFFKCDGYNDCPDQSDEKNCTINCSGFRCKNSGLCIPNEFLCDGIRDCKDSSDELNCNTSVISEKHCVEELGNFECSTGQCIRLSKLCDGKKDCPGNEDEGEFCKNSCANKKCSQKCHRLKEGPECYCFSGYSLDHDGRTCNDIDECKMTDGNICSHNCKNTKGSFQCSCLDGFKLVNSTKCLVQSSEPVLIYTDSRKIQGMWLRNNKKFLITKSVNYALGIDMNPLTKSIFWTDIGKKIASVYSVLFNGKKVEKVLSGGLMKPEDIAIDYRTRNFYISDSGLGKIIVCKGDGSACSTIIDKNIDYVKSLALNFADFLIYLSDWGENAGIYKARMDGSRMVGLITRNIVSPTGLTFDHVKQRLYWSDAKLERIEYYDFKTKERTIVIDYNVFHPHFITLFEDDLYWSDARAFSIFKCNKFTGHNFTNVISQKTKISGIHVYHPTNYVGSSNPCWSSTCSHICLIINANESRCTCPDNMYLAMNNVCAYKNVDNVLMVGLGKEIRKVYPDIVAKDVTNDFIDFHSKEIGRIGEFTYSYNRKTVYVYNGKDAIIKVGGNKQILKIISSDLDSLHSLVYDDFSDNLYWLNVEQGLCEIASSDGKNRRVLMNDLKNPSSLLLYQEKNEMFISQLGESPSIMVADLDGKNRKVILTDVGLPHALAISKYDNKLYWADSKRETIEVISLSNHYKSVVKAGVGLVISLQVNKDVLYWTDFYTNFLFSLKTRSKRKKVLTTSLSEKEAVKYKKLVFSYKQGVVNNCTSKSSGCSFLCVYDGLKSVRNGNNVESSTKCICPLDKRLAKDGKTCVDKSFCSVGYFTCQSNNKCIKQSQVCDRLKDCPNNEDEIGCPDVVPCTMYESRCDPNNLTSPCISSAWFCDGEKDCDNGFDELNCHNYTGKTIFSNIPFKSVSDGTCEPGYFKCDETKCLPWHFVCNGELNCLDKTDEGKNCMTKCSCKNNGRCIMDDNVWSCVCPANYYGRDCEFERKSSNGDKFGLKSNESTNKVVLHKNLDVNSSVISREFVDYTGSSSGTWFTIIVLVLIVATVSAIIGLIYVYDLQNNIELIRNGLNSNVNYGFRRRADGVAFDVNSPTVDLLDQMEIQPDG